MIVRVLLLFSLAAITSAQPPAIAPGGIVRLVNQMPASLGNGKLAPGAAIVIPGIRLVEGESPTTIHLEHESWSKSINPASVTVTKLTAVLPADTPVGELAISVSNAAGISRQEQLNVVASSPGIVTLNGEGWGPAVAQEVRGGQRAALHVDGLNETHPKVLVAGIPANGVQVRGEEVSFTVPRSAPAGCWTPVWIQSTTGEVSNFATLSIRGPRSACEQHPGWLARQSAPGTRSGTVILQRISGTLEITQGKPQEFGFDSGAGFFFHASAGDLARFQLLPPGSACTAYTGTFTFSAKPLFSVHSLLGPYDKPLEAGSSLEVVAPGGRQVDLGADEKLPGFYGELLGGVVPIVWGPGTPLFLDPGVYRVRSEGSADVSAFDLPLTVPAAFQWSNRAGISEVDRHAGLNLEWNNLGADRQMLALAFSVDQDTAAMGAAACLAPPGTSQLSIPAYALANFPATAPVGNLPLHFVMLISFPRSAIVAPPNGLDDLHASYMDIQVKSVKFR